MRRRARDDRPRPRRPAVARAARPHHRPRRDARGARRRAGALLRRVRPHRTQPAPRQPGADHHRDAPAARWSRALRPGRGCHRHDRRPARLGGAHPQQRRRRGRLGRAGAAADRAVPLLRGRQRRVHGQQLRLDREPLDDRLPPRRRQALPGQPDAGPRRGPEPARGGHQLHRVQLRAAAVDGLPGALPHPRRAPAVRWQRPVGQPHRWRRADQARRRRPSARVRHPAGHQGRRHQVRQDRGRRPVARPGHDVAVRLLPVLAQRRGRQGRRAAAHLHLPRSGGDRGARGADRGEAVPARRAEGARARGDHAGARA